MHTLGKTRSSTLHLEQNVGLEEDVHALIRDSEVELAVVLGKEVATQDGQGVGEKIEETKHCDLLVELFGFFLYFVN